MSGVFCLMIFTGSPNEMIFIYIALFKNIAHIVRLQKIRGHKRRHRAIQQWRLDNLELRLDLIEKYDYDNIDIVVHPWCDISIINSAIPEPKGKTKQLMLNGLIDIYHSWKEQLNKIGQPYYLKIWLYEPRFSKSQVVCAFGERIEHYEKFFFKPNQTPELKLTTFGNVKDKLKKLSWGYYLDEDHFENDYIGERKDYLTHADFEENKRWFIKMMKKPHRTTKVNDTTEFFSFKKGNLWLGGRD